MVKRVGFNIVQWAFLLAGPGLVAGAAAVAYHGGVAEPAASDASAAHYRRMLTYHLRMDACVPEGATVFIGDSIVQSLYGPNIVPTSVNFGVGSDTTAGLARRIRRFQCVRRAAAVVLSIGTVDLHLGRAIPAVLDDYRAVLAAVPPSVPVVMVAVLPVDETVDVVGVNDRIRALNQQLAALAALRRRCVWVDMTELLQDASGNLSWACHVGDGLHLNRWGYAILTARLREVLRMHCDVGLTPDAPRAAGS